MQEQSRRKTRNRSIGGTEHGKGADRGEDEKKREEEIKNIGVKNNGRTEAKLNQGRRRGGGEFEKNREKKINEQKMDQQKHSK